MNYDEKIHIEKVKKRVPRWKRNPDNFNHKILNAFFVLSEQLEQVSFTDLWYHCITKYGNDTKKPITKDKKSNFKQHFNHMSKMYSHNHAKVFEVSVNDTITLWNPTDDGSLPKFITEVWER